MVPLTGLQLGVDIRVEVAQFIFGHMQALVHADHAPETVIQGVAPHRIDKPDHRHVQIGVDLHPARQEAVGQILVRRRVHLVL